MEKLTVLPRPLAGFRASEQGEEKEKGRKGKGRGKEKENKGKRKSGGRVGEG